MDLLYKELIRFQVNRLKRDYEDFRTDPAYKVMSRFFFEDIYSTRDMIERNKSVRKLHDKVREALGEEAVRNLEKVIRLNEMTDKLDHNVVQQLKKIGVGKTFNESQYEEAYYLADDYDLREKQIDLILYALGYFHKLSQRRMVGIGLKLIKPYAILKKATSLHNFLTIGYNAFRSVKSVDRFYNEVKEREIERLKRIYSLGREVPTITELRRRAASMGIRSPEKMKTRDLMRSLADWV